MSNSNRKSKGSVEQLMRNMASQTHNNENQFIQMGFTPPSTPQEPWTMTNHHNFIPNYNLPAPEHSMSYGMEYNRSQVPFNYLEPQTLIYNRDPYEKCVNNELNYVYSTPSVHQEVLPDYKLFMTQKMHDNNYLQTQKENIHMNPSFINHPDCMLNNSQNRTPLIDNLVGNWTPNNSGTYSPFGSSAAFSTSNIFETNQECNAVQTDPQKSTEFERNEDIPNFQFNTNRDSKKPRMVAEVKPMRPSYSDVLLKNVTTTAKLNKIDLGRDLKQRKDIKKNNKNEKVSKVGGVLNRSNTSSEIKDLSSDKPSTKNYDKISKDYKLNNLNRKWASLDNVTETKSDFKADLNDGKKMKKNIELNKSASKVTHRKVGKHESNDTDSGSSKPDLTANNNKSIQRKGSKNGNKQKSYENYNSTERPNGKRLQRTRKRDNQVPFGIVGQKIKDYMGYWKYIAKFFVWLFYLITDVLSLSVHLSKDFGSNFYSWLIINMGLLYENSKAIAKRIKLFTWIYEKFKREKEPEKKPSFLHPGLQTNINMPTTGEEAMKRLLACKGKDPYSILGVTPTCTDSDIKNYYKKQAKLVHPDKNQQPGAEEAFKILVHAFDMIGEPERRAAYDRGVAESAQAEQAMTELTELLVQLQQKVEAAANTIRCSSCGLRHKRIKVDRPVYAARNCISCKIHHAAREGDIWAEAKCFGFLWYYFACMDGGVYDVTEWAGCQKDSLKHLKPDSHNVQYRIALGRQTNGTSRRPTSFRGDKNADLNNLFNNFYGQSDSSQGSKRKTKKTNK